MRGKESREKQTIHFQEVIDISTPLSAHTLVYPGDPQFQMTRVHSIDEDGSGYNLSTIAMSAHFGTHLDAPRHFIADGKCLHEMSAERWISHVCVIDTGEDAMIDVPRLRNANIEEGMAVLFRTSNCHALASGKMLDEFCALTYAAAAYLVERNIHLVGIDWLSIERYDDPAFPVHKKLLSNEILILENVLLHHVEAGEYTLVVSPLRLMDADGAPARALLLR